MDEHDQPNPDEPQKLRNALRRLEKERLFVPRTVDDTVARAAHEHFGQKEDGRGGEVEAIKPVRGEELIFHTKHKPVKIHTRVRRWHKWLPLAASITIAAVILFFARAERVVAGDINRDGALDVIDAMLLAERVRRGERPARNADVNGDGRVDARDSEEILARVVDLERSGS